jgi:hypothetical protein
LWCGRGRHGGGGAVLWRRGMGGNGMERIMATKIESQTKDQLSIFLSITALPCHPIIPVSCLATTVSGSGDRRLKMYQRKKNILFTF